MKNNARWIIAVVATVAASTATAGGVGILVPDLAPFLKCTRAFVAATDEPLDAEGSMVVMTGGTKRWRGVLGIGLADGAPVGLFQDADGDWTFVIMGPNGSVCGVAGGSGGEVIENPAPAGRGRPEPV